MFSVRVSIIFAILVAAVLLPTFAVSGTVVISPADYRQTAPSQTAEEQVTITFTVVDQNKFVTTLKKEDIRLSEDGVPQEIRDFQLQTGRPVSIAIVIDTSASQELVLPGAKLAAQEFLNAVVSRKDQVALVTFTGLPTIEQSLTNDRDRIRAAIDRVRFVPPPGYAGSGVVLSTKLPSRDQMIPGSTALWDTLWKTCENVFTPAAKDTRRAIILISDGEDTISKLKMKTAVERAIHDDVSIFSIGIGDKKFGVNKAVLKQLSERTGGRAFFPKSGNDINSIFVDVNEELRSQYAITYKPNSKSSHNSFHKVRIELTNPELRKMNLMLAHRDGY